MDLLIEGKLVKNDSETSDHSVTGCYTKSPSSEECESTEEHWGECSGALVLLA